MTIDPQTITGILQLGGQYLLPIAALLRALYSGTRGKLPEGFMQILAASFFAGLTAVANNQIFDLRAIALEILGNTAFTAGLLAFIIIYLLRTVSRGLVVDGIVGGIIGLVAWFGWVYILGNNWPWWTLPLAIVAGAAGFVVLRFLLRQIGRLVKLATYFIILGIVAILAAGGFWLFQTVLQRPG